MTDSVDTIDVKLDSGDIEAEVQSWLDSHSVTSVDDTEVTKIGPNRGVVTIMYTA